MKRYLIAVIIIPVLVSGLLLGCDSEADLRTEIDTLRSEIEQLKEQEKAENLQQAEAYYAIVELLPVQSSGEVRIVTGDEMLDAIAEQLKASGEFWGLIKATEDPYLISLCQPEGEVFKVVTCSYSHVRNYAEGKYRELMSEYYSQQYIDDQLALLDKSAETVEEEDIVNTLPFTYTGKGNNKTPMISLSRSQRTNVQVAFTTSWNGDISMTWYMIVGGKVWPHNQICRSTGTWSDFPNRIESGVTYEFVDYWGGNYEYYLEIGDAPPDGEWTVTMSQVAIGSFEPVKYFTYIFEYDGLSVAGSEMHCGEPKPNWRRASGNREGKIVGDIGLPIVYTFWRADDGTSPMTLKIQYEGKVVAEKTVAKLNEVHVIWLGPE